VIDRERTIIESFLKKFEVNGLHTTMSMCLPHMHESDEEKKKKSCKYSQIDLVKEVSKRDTNPSNGFL
jgi:hypothetical protein